MGCGKKMRKRTHSSDKSKVDTLLKNIIKEEGTPLLDKIKRGLRK